MATRVPSNRLVVPVVARLRVDFHRPPNYAAPARHSRSETDIASCPLERARFRRCCSRWYDRHGRDLPWRNTDDPYHILVSEMMLQQTQVDRVLPKYHEWLARYPSFEALAAAPEADVSATWRPLGYNIRPKRLHSIAREAVATYGGALPDDRETLLSFKGIGEYTAGAILSFAFRKRAAILDTNVARVLFRVFVGRGDPKGHATTQQLWAVSAVLVPRARVVRLQPGADGLRRHGLHGAQARLPGLSDGEVLPVLSVDRVTPQRRGGVSDRPGPIRLAASRADRRRRRVDPGLAGSPRRGPS